MLYYWKLCVYSGNKVMKTQLSTLQLPTYSGILFATALLNYVIIYLHLACALLLQF